MDYRLFIDDERFPVSPDWFVARNSYQAINAVAIYGMPTEIAFDHDLGGADTAMVFIKKLEDWIVDGTVKFPPNFSYTIHSQNPIGAANIKSMMDSLILHFA